MWLFYFIFLWVCVASVHVSVCAVTLSQRAVVFVVCKKDMCGTGCSDALPTHFMTKPNSGHMVFPGRSRASITERLVPIVRLDNLLILPNVDCNFSANIQSQTALAVWVNYFRRVDIVFQNNTETWTQYHFDHHDSIQHTNPAANLVFAETVSERFWLNSAKTY